MRKSGDYDPIGDESLLPPQLHQRHPERRGVYARVAWNAFWFVLWISLLLAGAILIVVAAFKWHTTEWHGVPVVRWFVLITSIIGLAPTIAVFVYFLSRWLSVTSSLVEYIIKPLALPASCLVFFCFVHFAWRPILGPKIEMDDFERALDTVSVFGIGASIGAVCVIMAHLVIVLHLFREQQWRRMARTLEHEHIFRKLWNNCSGAPAHAGTASSGPLLSSSAASAALFGTSALSASAPSLNADEHSSSDLWASRSASYVRDNFVEPLSTMARVQVDSLEPSSPSFVDFLHLQSQPSFQSDLNMFQLDSMHAAHTMTEAKELARRLFESMVGSSSGVIDENMLRSVAKLTDKEMTSVFDLFEAPDTRQISMQKWLAGWAYVVRTRRAFALTQRDGTQASVLRSIMWCLYTLFLFMFAVHLSGISLTGFVPLATSMLALSFMFGNSFKNLFDAMVFVLFIRPYDAGDDVVMEGQNGTAGFQVRINRVNLLTTAGHSLDGRLHVWSNFDPLSLRIINLSRSSAAVIMLQFRLPVNAVKVDALASVFEKVKEYLRRDPDTWMADECGVYVDTSGTHDAVTGTPLLSLNVRAPTVSLRWDRPQVVTQLRSGLLREVIRICGEHSVSLSFQE